jgi:hypothetical protein
MPADVVFDFGDRPSIPANDAIELAELLDRQGMEQQFETASLSLAAVVLASQIREQSGIFPNGQPMPDGYRKTQDSIRPNEYELIVLSEFLAAEPWLKSRPCTRSQARGRRGTLVQGRRQGGRGVPKLGDTRRVRCRVPGLVS